jgi:hypothetical protein
MCLVVGKVSWIFKSAEENRINYGNESYQLNYHPDSNYWPYRWRCLTSLLEAHR